MKRKAKRFDCVEMKNAIQAKLLEEQERLGEEEARRRHQQWVHTSSDPLAIWWRRLVRSEARRSDRRARGSALPD